MSIPVNTTSVSPLTVSDLLKKYQAGQITLQQLSDLFNFSVIWEYRGIEGDLKWSAVNSWETVHKATKDKIITSDDYLFLAHSFEAHIADGGTVLTKASLPPVVIPRKRGRLKRKPKTVKVSKKDSKVKTVQRVGQPVFVTTENSKPVEKNVVLVTEPIITPKIHEDASINAEKVVNIGTQNGNPATRSQEIETTGSATMSTIPEPPVLLKEPVKIVGGVISPPPIFHVNTAKNSEGK